MSLPKKWTPEDIPSQQGKLALITGGTRGLGYEIALALSAAGATVIITGRREKTGNEAIEKILALHPEAKISYETLNLSNLAQITEYCTQFLSKHDKLDLLICNAGLLPPLSRETTDDGFEQCFGTNYLSHFALTSQLLPALRKSPSPRVISVTSIAARKAQIKFEDLQGEKPPFKGRAMYGQSKLANILFASELQKRSDQGGWGLTSIVGFSKTNWAEHNPQMIGWLVRIQRMATAIMAQSAVEGALPILYAATSPEAKPGGFYGPQGFYEMKGQVGPAWVPPAANDEEVAKKLWDVSTELTKVTWP